MSSLRSTLEEIQHEDIDGQSVDELLDGLEELLHAREWVEALCARQVAAVAAVGAHHRDGYPSATALVKARGRMSGGHARDLVALSGLFTAAPRTAEAWLAGEVSTDQARVLSAARAESADTYTDHETGLIETVKGLSVWETRRAVDYWRQQAIAEPAAATAEEQRDQRRLHASRTLEGMVRVDGWLDPESGDLFLAALDAATPTPGTATTALRANAVPMPLSTWSEPAGRGLGNLK